jgi:serine/threonine protein phosphatase PrpC
VRVSYAAATDRGRARAFNEDFYCAEPALGLFAVADGAGPDAGGWVASRTVIRALRQFIAEAQDPHDAGWPCPFDATLSVAGNRLKAGLVMANRSLGACADQTASGSCAAIGAILFSDGLAAVTNTGGCRIHLARQGSLVRLSTRETARSHEGGPSHQDESSKVEILELPILAGDVWLLSTDGLHTALSEEVIASVLFDHESAMASRAQRFVDLAQTSGGADDVTVLAFQPQLSGDADARMAQMTSGVLEHNSGRARS